MPSLRTQLAFWLLFPLLSMWAFNAWLTYESSLEAANRAHDRTLLGSILAIAERTSVVDGAVVVDLPYSSLEMLESSLQSRVYYRVSQAGSRHITGYEDLKPPTTALELGKPFFYDSQYLGERVRVAAILKRLYEPSMKEPVLIQVAETGELRESMSWQMVTESARKELLLIVLAALLMWWAVNRGLRPLYKLRDEVSQRGRNDLSRIEVDALPRELKPLIQAINEHTAQVTRLIGAQKQFVADAAHQLKTPLAVLRTQAEFASKQTDPAAVNEVLEDMRANTGRVSRLVDQLLALNRAEAITPSFERLDLAELARNTAFDWLPAAIGKSIDLGFEGDGPVPIEGNKVLLRELIANLLDNALRFTPSHGRVTVRVAAERAGAMMSIEDTGLGIPVEQRDRIFDRFYQIPGRDSPGCGLGLAITREIANLHAATVRLGDTEGGHGARFEVRFPATAGKSSEAAAMKKGPGL
jgi:two-component system, OmpR family, sensor histidine kinase TctE